MATAVIGIEGVLAQVEREGLIEAPVITSGVQLVEGLSSQFTIVYTTSIPDEDMVKTWLTTRRIHKPAAVLGPWSSRLYPDRKDRIKDVRQGGTIVDLVVDADPDVCAEAIKQGVNTILFTAVKSAWTYRPPTEMAAVPWNQMMQNIRRERELQESAEVDEAMEMGRID